ncbi:hypothetical protein HGRIS_008966 [Hohenbuehelia grisea]|uniref:Glycosyl hydrolase family 92 domain-containing protein n=1 Tax=Hohenbuehelia grisea TaxID=104357 RepID=A0ABR3IZP0_9AGAR
MSAWYLFSALGFYPVNPASGDYVVGSPFFNKVTIQFPGARKPLVVTSRGAPDKVFVQTLQLNGKTLQEPVLRHEQIAFGGKLDFKMSSLASRS